MSIRAVCRIPEPVLKRRADEIVPPEAAALIDDLVETMRASPACVGLAAPQVGVGARAFVVDVTDHPKTTTCHGLIAFLNPVVVASGPLAIGREGCMSVPDLTANVARATSIVVRGVGVDGGEIEIETEGFEARAVQHEIDHLDGMLILDRVASLATDVFRRKVYR